MARQRTLDPRIGVRISVGQLCLGGLIFKSVPKGFNVGVNPTPNTKYARVADCNALVSKTGYVG